MASFAQNSNTVGSLQKILKIAGKKKKPAILNELAKAYLPDFPDNAKENAVLALQLAEKQNNKNEQAFALKYTGVALYYQSEYEKALEYYNNSLNIFNEIGNKIEVANSLNNIGLVYCEINNYENALEYYQKSLKISEKIDNKKGIANSLNNIGIILISATN